MPAAELHFFDADDPNGSTIFECSTDDQFVKSIELDIQRDSLGSGKVNFARKTGTGLFTRQIVVPEVLVRVLVPSVHPTKYFYGFFINPRQQQVVSKAEQGGEGFTFAGPGPKHYLERMILWSASFTGIDSAVDKEAGIWRWPETAKAGRILDRLIDEDQANPSGPFLPDLTKSFDAIDDSDGNPWTEDVSDGEGSFTLRISDDYLKQLWTVEDVSGITSQIYLGEVGDPKIRLDVWESYGRDLTADVQFVEGVNISTDLTVEGSSYRKASHALVRGTDGVYNLAFKSSWSPGDLKKVVGTSFDSNSGSVLDRAGERFLTRQDNGEEQIDLAIVTGFDPTNGLYMPGPDYVGGLGHFWVGDSISLTTGQGSQTALDYDDETEVVTGIELELAEAVRDDTDEQAARSFAVTVKLNEERKSNHTARDLAGNRGTVAGPPNILQLCRLPIEGTDEVIRLYPSNDDSGLTADPPIDASWEEESGVSLIKKLKTTADGTYSATAQQTSSDGGLAGGQDVYYSRWAIEMDAGMAAVLAAGGATVRGQFRCRARFGIGISEANQDMISQIGFRVTTGDSTTIRGTALALHSLASSAGSSKWPAQSTKVNKQFPAEAAGSTLTAVSGAAAGDFLIVEVGSRNYTTSTSGGALSPTNDADSDLPYDDITTSPLNSWIELHVSGSGGFEGDLPQDTVRQGEASVGTSTRVARCDHQHEHGLLSADGINYHDAGDVTGTLQDVDPALAPDDGDVLTWDDTLQLWVAAAGGGGGGAPTTADYLVGTAQGGLSAEIVVGTTPGGELGGTWASPTVDGTHSGSAHHSEDHNHTGGGDGGDLDAALIGDYLVFTEASAPSTPASGFARLYVKTDGRVYSKGDDGVERGPFDAAGAGSSGAPPGYPSIAAVAVTQSTANTTSHVVNLPTGIVSGSLLILVMALDGTPTISATGWTAIGTFAASNTVALGGLYRIADGSEGASVTVTSSASEKAEAWVGRFVDHHASAPPEGASQATGTASTLIEQPTVTPSWGATTTTWLSVGAWDLSAGAGIVVELDWYGYTAVWQRGTGATDGVGLVLSIGYVNAVSQDTQFRTSASEQNTGGIIAIRPV